MRFQLRSFISFSLLMAFGVLASSGLALYLRPEGSLARWTGWTLLGLTKNDWEGMHAFAAATFVIIAVVHLILNWKSFANYLYDRLVRGLRRRNELLASFGLIGIVLLLAVFQVQPAWMIMDLRSDIKNGVLLPSPKPPESDFDKTTLAQLAERANVNVKRMIEKMRVHGLSVDNEEESLLVIAERNGLSPQSVYRRVLELSVE